MTLDTEQQPSSHTHNQTPTTDWSIQTNNPTSPILQSPIPSLIPQIHRIFTFVNEFNQIPRGDQIYYLKMDEQLFHRPVELLVFCDMTSNEILAEIESSGLRLAVIFSQLLKRGWNQLSSFAQLYCQLIELVKQKEGLLSEVSLSEKIEMIYQRVTNNAVGQQEVEQDQHAKMSQQELIQVVPRKYAQYLVSNYYGGRKWQEMVDFITVQTQFKLLEILQNNIIMFQIRDQFEFRNLIKLIEDVCLSAAVYAIQKFRDQ